MAGLSTAPAEAQVELRNISKRFGGVQAVRSASLAIARGTVHGIVGENGAGKSTLGKIIAGVIAPDEGTLLVRGEPVKFRSPREALVDGIAMVSQEASIVPGLTAYENVLLGAESRRVGFIRRRELRRRYTELTDRAGFDVPLRRRGGTLRTADQQKIEILRALNRDAELLVLDEPTAALSAPEAEHLHEIVRNLASLGKTVILVSHFLGEVLALADVVTVMRDGHIVRTAPSADETEDSLISAMLGRSLARTFPDKRIVAGDAPVVLSVRDLQAVGATDVTIELRAGEIVGVAGLVGAGRTELARAIYGADRLIAGEVSVAGQRLTRLSPRRGMDAGVVMLPESRKDDGLIFTRNVIQNVSVASLSHFSRAGFVRRAAERDGATEALERCAVTGRYSAPVGALSGGNQQKTLFARTLLRSPRVLIADEPTRGVDVGAKRNIYEMLVDLAGSGLAVLLISSEVEEIVGLAHRVLVMRGGRVVRELEGASINEAVILAAAFDRASPQPDSSA
jgi:simple sugar transport system ATP-binding protein/ribose transport system ATP-binding protein